MVTNKKYNGNNVLSSGVVLHMAFQLSDGTDHMVDMDLNVPSLKTSNGQEYNGGIKDYQLFLMRTRPILWRDEMSKLEDMSSRASSAETSLRIRSINPDTVTTSEVRRVELVRLNINRMLSGFVVPQKGDSEWQQVACLRANEAFKKPDCWRGDVLQDQVGSRGDADEHPQLR